MHGSGGVDLVGSDDEDSRVKYASFFFLYHCFDIDVDSGLRLPRERIVRRVLPLRAVDPICFMIVMRKTCCRDGVTVTKSLKKNPGRMGTLMHTLLRCDVLK